jgi:NADH-quinone oxidoreductase subunit J
MPILFYISSVIAILATIMVITRYEPIHALLYLVVSFLAVAMIFLSIGAPFVAVLEVILYTGAIIVLFIFVVMMLNLGKGTAAQEKEWLKPRVWVGPALLVGMLLALLVVFILKGSEGDMRVAAVDVKAVSLSLYQEYILALELAGFLLMAGIVGAAHIGKHKKKHLHRYLQEDEVTASKLTDEMQPIQVEKEEKEQVDIY